MSNSSKTLAWVGWMLSLLASPAAMVVLARTYYRPPDPANFRREMPWQAGVVAYLLVLHLAVSCAAVVCVFRSVGDWSVRRHVCYAVLLLLVITAFVAVVASMDVTGRYL
jgi:hypothetical protein